MDARRTVWTFVSLVVGLLTAIVLALSACSGGDGSDTVQGDDAGDGSAGDGGPDASACVPKTCEQLGATCGSAPDGCGGKVTCGTCPTGQHCGGGGTNKCGTNPCIPKTCSQVGASCGYASDKCAVALDCGSCPAPETCGGAGTQNQCGCTPKTCAEFGYDCGSAPDGCGGTIDCGNCTAGQTCGGGGQNKCGTGTCSPKTCAQLGASCGSLSDGCGKTLNCGTCTSPQTCGGGGQPNQCGCTPKTCVQLSATCGQHPSGCGTTLDCGNCSLPNATATCNNGTCTISQCASGYGNCDGDPIDGCEANLNSDPNHCSTCTNVCMATGGTAVCNGGTCAVSTCASGKGNCDGNAANGCEADLLTDPQNCGFCNNPCVLPNASASCSGGNCVIAACNPGWADCDGLASNGCEINTTNDTQHCGGCTNACGVANGSAGCQNGSCFLAGCNPGWGDCDGQYVTGCETQTSSDIGHCGSCSTDCSNPLPPNVAGIACNSGTCVLTGCSPNFFDQDGAFGDGCECGVDSISDSCSGAASMGNVGLGGSASGSGNIMPQSDSDWFVVSFSGNDSCSYHPAVSLNDPSGTLRMDVTTDCSSQLGCQEGGTSGGVTAWEFTFAAPCGTNSSIDTGRFPADTTTVYIHVYAIASTSSCAAYSVTATN